MLFRLLDLIVNLLIILIIARAILSWLPEVRMRYRPLIGWIDRITDPILQPFRQLISPHRTGGIDLSPILAIFAIQILWRIIIDLVY
jgi:YggT family protein